MGPAVATVAAVRNIPIPVAEYGHIGFPVAIVIAGNGFIGPQTPVHHINTAIGGAPDPPITGRGPKDRDVRPVVSVVIAGNWNIGAEAELDRFQSAGIALDNVPTCIRGTEISN